MPISSHFTKHYYFESDRIVSKIGGGMALNIVPLDTCMYAFDIKNIDDYKDKSDANSKMMYRHFDSTHVEDEVLVEAKFGWLNDCANYNDFERDIYFYHKDHRNYCV